MASQSNDAEKTFRLQSYMNVSALVKGSKAETLDKEWELAKDVFLHQP